MAVVTLTSHKLKSQAVSDLVSAPEQATKSAQSERLRDQQLETSF